MPRSVTPRLAGGGLLGGGLAGRRLPGRGLLRGDLLRRGLLRRRLLGGGLLRRGGLGGRRGLGGRLLRGGLLRRGGGLLGRRLLGRGLLRGRLGGLLRGGLLHRRGGAAGQAALGRLLHGDLAAPRQLLGAAHQVLEALSGAEPRHGGLLDPNPLARLGVAGVAGGAVDLLEGPEACDRDPLARDDRADDGVQDMIDGIGGLLAAAHLVGNRFYELRLVHVFPFGDIARTNVFKLFRTLGRYIPQIKHETGLSPLCRNRLGVLGLFSGPRRGSDPRRGPR
ncbi:conserved hypothetical protein [Streptomyces misionensis JCM 4497]